MLRSGFSPRMVTLLLPVLLSSLDSSMAPLESAVTITDQTAFSDSMGAVNVHVSVVEAPTFRPVTVLV